MYVHCRKFMYTGFRKTNNLAYKISMIIMNYINWNIKLDNHILLFIVRERFNTECIKILQKS
jgi:hypothetical protein